jgi:outer membrane protein
MIVSALPLMLAGALQAQDATALAASPIASDVAEIAAPQVAAPRNLARETSRWFVRAGILRAHYNSGARIAINGEVIHGASASVTDNLTASFDIGYEISDKFAVMLMGGIPPKAAVTGKGAVAPFGKLGEVRFGPAILTGIYRFPRWRGLRPYVGAGGTRLFILKAEDGAVSQLRVHDSWGAVVQAGVEYSLNRKWELFVDYKRLWLKVDAEGRLGGAPVRARVTLDPDVVSAGVKFHFK